MMYVVLNVVKLSATMLSVVEPILASLISAFPILLSQRTSASLGVNSIKNCELVMMMFQPEIYSIVSLKYAAKLITKKLIVFKIKSNVRQNISEKCFYFLIKFKCLNYSKYPEQIKK